MTDQKAIETQLKAVGYTLLAIGVAAILIASLGELFLERHDIKMILIGMAVAAVASLLSLLIPD